MQRKISVASLGLLCGVASLCALPPSAQAQANGVVDSNQGADLGGHEEPEQERRNGIELGFTHDLQLLRTSPSEAEAGSSENLFGFVIAYERALIPGRLTLVIAKPFRFTRDRFDSPLDIFLKVNFPKGRWEPYIGPGISGNLRVFGGELEQEEGRRLEYTFGVGGIAGFIYFLKPRWGLSVELGYLYFINGLTRHSISDSLACIFLF